MQSPGHSPALQVALFPLSHEDPKQRLTATPAVAAKRFPRAQRLVRRRSEGAITGCISESLRVGEEEGTSTAEASSCTPPEVQIRLEATQQ